MTNALPPRSPPHKANIARGCALKSVIADTSRLGEEFARDPLERRINILHAYPFDAERKFLVMRNIHRGILQLQQQAVAFGQCRAFVEARRVLGKDQPGGTGKDQFILSAIIFDQLFPRLRAGTAELRRLAMGMAALDETVRPRFGVHIRQIEEKLQKRRAVVVIMIDMRGIDSVKNRIEPE